MKKQIKILCRKFPALGVALVSALHPVRFRKERRAYRNRATDCPSDKRSVVFMTHNRCASVMVHNRLLDLLEPDSFKHFDYQGFVQLKSDEQIENFRFDKDSRNSDRFQSKGHYYGPLRYFVQIPDISNYNLLIVLRDPRDVLVSRYYSEKYSHFRFDKRFAEHCKYVETITVDEFVVEFSGDVLAHYQDFIKNWSSLENSLFVRYEELIEDFEGFLSRFANHANLEISKEEIERVAHKESFNVDEENKFAHKRSVKSGAFREKLREDTIARLNSEMSEVLAFFGYSDS